MAEVVEMLALSPTMDEGTLAEWVKTEGDSIAEGDILAEVETDKATMEMESFFDGTVLKTLVEPGDAVEVGMPIAVIGEDGEDISDLVESLKSGATGDSGDSGDSGDEEFGESDEVEASEATESSVEEADTEESTSTESYPGDGRLRASPLAKRMASEADLPLERIDGSGPKGRIIKRDIERVKEEGLPTAGEAVDLEGISGEKIELSQMRKTIASRLQDAWQNTPHFALTIEIDMGKAMDYRSDINEQLEAAKRGPKISVNDIIVKASAEALVNYPAMNVSYQGDHIVEFEDVHVGFAVAVEEGLITPVIEHTDNKSLGDVAAEGRELAKRAQNKKLSPDEYSGGTFTVSNLGMYGIDEFMAVINPPQASILACGAVKEKPVVQDGELAVGTGMLVTLSCDHRAVDGATGAEFLQELKTLLENPALLTV